MDRSINLQLVQPSMEWQSKLFAYRDEMYANGEVNLYGGWVLDRCATLEEWLQHIHSYSNRATIDPASGYVEGSQWLLVDLSSRRVLGMANIRHYLNDDLLLSTGHISYSIRPSERNKGYGKLQLQLGLEFLAKIGVKKSLVTCDFHNESSYRTIEACGGQLENVIEDPEVKRLVRRYWLDIPIAQS